MRKRLAVVLVLILSGTVSAHGSPPPREIDLRVMEDHEDNQDYGTLNDQGVPLLYEGGHDLLALDVRELADAAGRHLIEFNLWMQFGDPSQGTLRDEIHFTTPAGPVVLSVSTDDHVTWTGSGPAQVTALAFGDEHSHGVRFLLDGAAVGLDPSSRLEGLYVQGFVGASRADHMPGDYTYLGQAVGHEVEPVSHGLSGPAPLLLARLESAEQVPDNATSITVLVESPLTSLDQWVSVDAPGAAQATGLVAPSAVRRFEMTVPMLPDPHNVTVRVHSDLGGLATIPVRIPAIPVAPVADPGPPADDRDAPALWALPVLIGLAWWRRNKR